MLSPYYFFSGASKKVSNLSKLNSVKKIYFLKTWLFNVKKTAWCIFTLFKERTFNFGKCREKHFLKKILTFLEKIRTIVTFIFWKIRTSEQNKNLILRKKIQFLISIIIRFPLCSYVSKDWPYIASKFIWNKMPALGAVYRW